MPKLFHAFHKLAEVGTLLSLFGMITAVTIQVFARFFLPSAPSWTEEVARMFFIYMVAFGAGLGIRSDDYVKLTLIQNWIGERIYQKVYLLMQLFIALFFGILFYFALDFVPIGAYERSPGLLLPMWLAFISMPVLMLSMVIFSIEKIILLTKL